ncbi:MAG: PBECR4 domain-containing protein [Lachnospiraceae bacterium]|nr:PBECR4 domain-containing protein [Lachnospiraceae bacterium]MDY4208339.1 PBECR4 domain-containing protein [Lachnospiraceae bacterium]
MKYDKKKALEIIVEAAKQYDKWLKSNHFLIFYQKGKEQDFVEVGFRDLNFLHLTGIKTKLSAQRFFSLCIDGKLSEKDYDLDTKGKAQQKLMVLPFLHELLYHNCMIGDFINSGVLIKSDYFVGDTKAVLSVGFRSGKTVDMPVTLYKENVKKLIKPVCKVLAIFKKPYNQQTYTECTYCSKGINLSELSLPDKVEVFLSAEEEMIKR